MESTQITKVSGAPTSAATREPVPANGHVRAREVRPREIGLAHAQPNDGELGRRERDEDAERVEAREERGVAVGAELGHEDEHDREPGRQRDRLARNDCAALEPRELARKRAVLRERVREPGDPRERGRRGSDEDEDARDPDRDLERVDDEVGKRSVERRRDPEERQLEPLLAERRLPVLDRIGGEADRADEHRHDDDEPDGREERARQRAPRLGRLLGEVRNRLEPGVGEHRERQREREVAPVLAAREAEPVDERGRREQEREPEHDEQRLHDEVEERDGERPEVESRAPEDPDPGDHHDDRAADDRVPGRLAQGRLAERPGEVVRHEERRERHDDEEVEEEHPSGHESGEVVERASDERRRAARLGQRRRPLRVRERDEDEHGARDEENERRQPERDARPRCRARCRARTRSPRTRRRTAPARRGRARSHGACGPSARPLPFQGESADTEHDEERADDVADDSAARGRGPDEQRHTERREHEPRTRTRRACTASSRRAFRRDHDAAARVLQHVVDRLPEDRRLRARVR